MALQLYDSVVIQDNKRRLQVALLMLALGYISGCETYSKLKHHRDVYCDDTADSVMKKAAIFAIQLKVPGYPIEGICTDLGLKNLEEAKSEKDKALKCE